jgi:RNA polymerase sigma-70 factor (ECF subfamily)
MTTTTERLGTLFDACHGRLYRLARRLVSDPEEARDLVQEAFLRAARRLHSLPADDPGAEAWLTRVVVNLCRDRHRRLAVRRRDARHLATPATDPASSPEDRAAARSAVEAALATLPARRRAVVVLHELEELGTAEIARLLGVTRVTVRWHLAAGRKDLARQLLGADPPHETARREETP